MWFSLLVLALILFGLFLAAYTLAYNHRLIAYLSPNSVSNVNQYIRQLSREGVSILEVEEADDAPPQVADHRDAGTGAHVAVRATFSLGVALSTTLVVLILCELMGFFDAAARICLFRAVIDGLIVLLTIVQPFLVLCVAVYQHVVPPVGRAAGRSLGRLCVLVGAYGGWFVVLHKCGTLSHSFVAADTATSTASRNILERKINEVSITGITVMAVLSGVGSMSTPYRQFPSVYTKMRQLGGDSAAAYGRHAARRITPQHLNHLIQSHNHTQQLMHKRMHQLQSLHEKNMQSQPTLVRPPSSSKLRGLVKSFTSLTSLATRAKSEEAELTTEIAALTTLRSQIHDDVMTMLQKYARQQDWHSRSWPARVAQWLDWGFGAYCVYRILNVIVIRLPHSPFRVALAGDPSATNDALAITIAKLLRTIIQLPVTETQLVYQISFLLSGGLFLCSISNVVFTLRSFGRFVPSVGAHYSPDSMTWLMHLAVSELLGIYVMSTALLIRTNLPTNLSQQVSKILSLSGTASSSDALQEVELIDLWFDQVFAGTCVVTLLVLVIKGYLDEEDGYDEESMVEA
ncbi:Abscisic acid G-protein coupled receptor-like domain-containing protein [[Candida] zeylanoides]